MITQKTKILEQVQKTANVLYRLRLLRISQKMIAEELNLTPATVNGVIHGKRTSKRVSNWLKENLGIGDDLAVKKVVTAEIGRLKNEQ